MSAWVYECPLCGRSEGVETVFTTAGPVAGICHSCGVLWKADRKPERVPTNVQRFDSGAELITVDLNAPPAGTRRG